MSETLIYDSPEFIWNPKANRYQFKEGGQFVNANQFRFLTQKFIETSRRNILDLFDERKEGLLDQSTWRTETLKSLKTVSIQTYVLHRGGAGRMTTTDQRLIAGHLNRQFRYFRNLSAQINQGFITDQEARRRLRLYTDNMVVVESIAKQQNVGAEESFGFRILGNAEPCPDCIGHASRGIMRLEDLVAPGTQCICGHNCHCSTYIFENAEAALKAMQTGKRKGAFQIQLNRAPIKL